VRRGERRRLSGAAYVTFEQIARDQRWIALGRRPVAAATREPNLYERARGHELLGLWIRRRHAVDQHRASRARPAAAESGGRMHRAIAEDRGGERLARAHAEGDGLAQAAAVFSRAARIVAQALLLDDQWRQVLDDLDRGARTPDGNAVAESPS